jgi:hypothetical protein
MKKMLLVLGLGILWLLGSGWPVRADTYASYQDIVFDEEDQKLLKDYSDSEYSDHYGKLGKRLFIGWKLVVVTEDQAVDFVSETKLKIYNRGYSTIKHEITLKTTEENQFQISATGSIGVNVKGSDKKFSGALDTDIKATVDYEKTTTESEEYVFKISVDPGTYVTIITRGEGLVNNGVAQNYFFWIPIKKGGWETFTVTTEYFEIMKDRLA